MEEKDDLSNGTRSQADASTNKDQPGGFFFNDMALTMPAPEPLSSSKSPVQCSLENFKFTSLIVPATSSSSVSQLTYGNQSVSLDPINSNAAMGVLRSTEIVMQPGTSSVQSPLGPSSSTILPLVGSVKYTEAAPVATGAFAATAATNDGQKKGGFQLDTSRIHTTAMTDQSSELAALGLDVFNADQFEQGVMAQVDQHIAAEEKERRDKILNKELKTVTEDINTVKVELMNIDKVVGMMKPKPGDQNKEILRKMEAIKRQKENKLKQLKKLKAKQKSLKKKVYGNQDNLDDDDALFDEGDTLALEQALGLSLQNETEHERMIRTGEMTPFGTVVKKPEKPKSSIRLSTSEPTDFEKFLMGQGSKVKEKTPVKAKKSTSSDITKMRKNSSEPNLEKLKKHVKKMDDADIAREKRLIDIAKGRKKEHKRKNSPEREYSPKRRNSAEDELQTQRRKKNFFDAKDGRSYRTEADFSNWQSGKAKYPRLEHEWTGDGEVDCAQEEGSGDEYRPSGDDCMEESDGDRSLDCTPIPSKRLKQKRKKKSTLPKEFHGSGSEVEEVAEEEDERPTLGEIRRQYTKANKRDKDDGEEGAYEKRLGQFQKEELKKKRKKIIAGEDADSEEVSESEFDDGFKVPPKIWNRLYRYQKTCVRWLWELHCQDAGGIVGDEMGMGKTIQMIAFLAGLSVSKLRDKNAGYVGCGPVIIVCPTTVMHQWVKEFHIWWPPFRVAVLHSSGSFSSSEAELVKDIVKKHGVLITSYGSMLVHQDIILRYNWHYVVLDEGHKIRNPDAQVTLACKQFRTPHRFILSGSPLQNNLKELWSLFDFVFPGKLSTLPEFMSHFSIPITQGGYSNATQVQVQTAYKCACVLRDTINPYLLRRMKADVQSNLNLPKKSEQVLFCRLTEDQKEVYKEYIDSRECQQILAGNFMVFPGLITLRKICNHPDLCTGGPKNFNFDKTFDDSDPSTHFGYWKRSGKMIVVKSLLKIWKQQGQRVLLFSQSKQMLDILEAFIQREGYSYMRMDGGTPIGSRQSLINHYNNTLSMFIFLLTTRVGGLGVNLTGANRVIIFDPDWNPSTDTQARERAWRIGQTKQVTIYRLLTTGTIEEKIYHRQIFKQFLANRVLKDPKQRRFFKSNDLYELFTLGSQENRHGTETHAIFAGTGSNIDIKPMAKKESVEKSEPEKTNRFDLMRARQPKVKEEVVSDEEGESVTSIKRSVKGKYAYKSAANGRSKSQDNNDTSGEKKLPSFKIKKLKDKDGATGDDDEYDDDDMPKITSNKLSWMKELAKKLSQKISKGETPATDNRESPKPSSDGDSVTSSAQIQLLEPNRDSPRPGMSTCRDSPKPGKEKDGSRRGYERKDHKEQSRSRKERDGSRKHSDHKEREHRKNKKRRHRDAEFEGEKIDHLVSLDEWKQEKEEDAEEKNKEENDFVLSTLFKKSGVHSAMQHDVIMGSSNPDYALVEGEAERVAKEAAKALKVSKGLLKGAARSGIPTWTGQSGLIGLPKPKPRFGQKKNSLLLPSFTPEKQDEPKEQSSTDNTLFNGEYSGLTKSATFSSSPKKSSFNSGQLLQRMLQRNYGTKSGSDSDHGEEGEPPVLPTLVTEHTQLITDMRNFIAFQASNSFHATTRELLDEFGHRLPPQDSAKFKAMLHQICTFEKQNNIGVWSLKPEFR
ncbi:DNA excision repair protein ERCC-6-like [Lineus longissimus]|uniref:DNA excision repair protein ERCC-6-like n=1 Tax=Lineus longissimus TaxID=88925 RepID=UPI002B4E5842